MRDLSELSPQIAPTGQGAGAVSSNELASAPPGGVPMHELPDRAHPVVPLLDADELGDTRRHTSRGDDGALGGPPAWQHTR